MGNTEWNINVPCIIIFTIFVAVISYSVYSQIEDYKLSSDPKLIELKQIFTKFFKTGPHSPSMVSGKKYWTGKLKKLNKKDIMKDISLYRGDKSYTLNKERVFLCLKDENNEYYPIGMLKYVFAHELAHVLCDSVGHTPEFYEIFDELLIELTKHGIYDPSTPLITDYCHNGDDLQ